MVQAAVAAAAAPDRLTGIGELVLGVRGRAEAGAVGDLNTESDFLG